MNPESYSETEAAIYIKGFKGPGATVSAAHKWTVIESALYKSTTN